MKDNIREELPENYEIDGFNLVRSDKLRDRAFIELKENEIVDENLDYLEERIRYDTKNGQQIGVVIYAIFEDVGYISWVSVKDPYQDNGLGTELVRRSISRMKEEHVDRVYVLPKSDVARVIFDRKLGFEMSAEIDSFYKKDI